jgi:hypothetical protein
MVVRSVHCARLPTAARALSATVERRSSGTAPECSRAAVENLISIREQFGGMYIRIM